MRNRCLLGLLVVAGCGDNIKPTEKPDAPPPPDAPPAFVEAPHQAPPQMVSNGGDVLTTPKIRPIFFTGDSAMQAQVEDFLKMMASSTYWTATTAEYGVGPVTILPTIVSTDPPPTTYAALNTWLTAQLDGTHAAWGTPDPETIYSVYLPDGVVLTTPFGPSCNAFGAFHDEAKGTHNESIVYALMPRCNGGSLDALTDSSSHEFTEAVTDPRVETTGAFGDVDKDHYVLNVTPGAEVGDMCEYVHEAYQRIVGPYDVQRTWSNASALAGHDPCVPAMPGAYVGAAPKLDDSVPIDFGGMGGKFMTKGVQIPVGTSKTIEVDLFSDAPAADWTVKALDVGSSFGGGAAELTFTWDRTTGHNGDKLQLTITRATAGQTGGSEFMLSSRVNNVSVSQWWGFVAN